MTYPIPTFRLNTAQCMGLLEEFRRSFDTLSYARDAEGLLDVFTKRTGTPYAAADIKTELARCQDRTRRYATAACSEPGFVFYSVLTIILYFGDIA